MTKSADRLSMTCPACFRTFSYPRSGSEKFARCPSCDESIKLEGDVPWARFDSEQESEPEPQMPVVEPSTAVAPRVVRGGRRPRWLLGGSLAFLSVFAAGAVIWFLQADAFNDRGRPSGSTDGGDPQFSSQSTTTLTHWLNTETNTRHNDSCRWFRKTDGGRMCAANEGEPCGRCGG